MYQNHPSTPVRKEPAVLPAQTILIKEETPPDQSVRIVIPAPPEPGRIRWSLAPL